MPSRYYLHFAGNLLLLLPQVPSFSPVFLRGPSVAVYEGMLLPLCCTVGASLELCVRKVECSVGCTVVGCAVGGLELPGPGLLVLVTNRYGARSFMASHSLPAHYMAMQWLQRVPFLCCLSSHELVTLALQAPAALRYSASSMLTS